MNVCRFFTLILCSSLVFSHTGLTQGIDPNVPLRTVVIDDPTFGDSKAFTITIPSNWEFQGTVIARLRCDLPSPVFRAYSPDGLTEIRLLPSFTWQMEEKDASGSEGSGAEHECIYLNGSMTAAQFLDRYVRSLGPVHVLGPMSIAAGYRQQLDQLLNRMNANQPKDPKTHMQATGDAAALRIETTNGTFTIEQRLRARVVCILWPRAIAGKLGSCSARLDVLRAPKDQLDALVNLVDSHNLTTAKNDDLWLNKVAAEISGNQNHFDPYVPNRTALALLYRQASDFGLVLKPQGDRQPLYPSVATSDNAISDWADFALNPKPIKEDADGIVHIASTMRYWSSSSGQQYQTGNPGANPNGVLPGRWTGKENPETAGPQ